MGIRHRLVNGPLGFGAAPLGNMFRELTDEEAAATVDAAWQHEPVSSTPHRNTVPAYPKSGSAGSWPNTTETNTS